MTEFKANTEVGGGWIEAATEQLRGVSPKEQEGIYTLLLKAHPDPEAREQLAAIKARLELEEELGRRAAEIQKDIEKPIEPEVSEKQGVTVGDLLKLPSGKRTVRELVKGPGEDGEEVEFHESDLAPKPGPTIDERNMLLEELADLLKVDPIGYVGKRKELAKRLAVNQEAIDKAVKVVKDKRGEEGEQSQVTKVMAIGYGPDVKLWHSENGDGYASVRRNGVWEHHRVQSSGFESWLRTEYGRMNRVQVGDRWVPQVPGAQAVRDAMGSLESYAYNNGEQHEVCMRVGGDLETIWLDLGREDRKVVKITGRGWDVVSEAGVRFVRTRTMSPLPIPVRGGMVQDLGKVFNVKPLDMVLVAGWMVQALNPVGDYPFINVHGESEFGKTFLCTHILKTIDPRTTKLRRAKRADDLLIAARNNWTIGYDNFSYMSADFSDTLCMVSTEITSGSRTLYTDDEEHTFTVRRPIIFNGIPSHLTERSDLASRTIKLELPKITQRRRKSDLEREFAGVWPRVLSGLLDGMVAGLRDQGSIVVEEPARLIDFECFAEAACRGMGFGEWEFVNAYKANRHGSMVASAEASAVGQAVVKWLKFNPGGFRGQMSVLYSNLGDYKGTANWRSWPVDAARLSSELTRIGKPLAAIGIRCLTRVDRRHAGGTQWDVIIEYDKPQTVSSLLNREPVQITVEAQAEAETVAKVVPFKMRRRI